MHVLFGGACRGRSCLPVVHDDDSGMTWTWREMDPSVEVVMTGFYHVARPRLASLVTKGNCWCFFVLLGCFGMSALGQDGIDG